MRKPTRSSTLPELAIEAGQRWQRREKSRESNLAALARKEYTKADTPSRLVARIKRLDKWVEAAAASGKLSPEAARESAATATLRPEDITDELVERKIGETRDLLSIEFFEQGLDAAQAVGRVVSFGEANGTGFLVAPNLMLTNHHVLGTEQEAAASQLEMDYEANRFGPAKRVQTFQLLPERFFYSNKEHDFALVAVAPTSSSGASLETYGFRPLIGEEGKARIGESINIIQHPDGEEKQIVVRESRLVDLPDLPGMDAFFHYTADTERGSSGSPVFNDQWEVVALHHSAVPKTNDAGEVVDASGKVLQRKDIPARVVWVANEGIRVSRIVKQLRAAELRNAADDALRAATLRTWETHGLPAVQENASEGRGRGQRTTPPAVPSPAPLPVPVERRRPAQAAVPQPEVRPVPAAGALELIVPLRVSLALGEPGPGLPGAPRAPAQALDALDLLERIEPDPSDPDYRNRPGFRRDFLDFEVPLPELADDTRWGPLATFGAGESELRYHHYSVLMNERRRLAYLAAVNIDAGAPFSQNREGSDRWFFDPRLPQRVQAGNEFYRDNPLDRGHLVRRDDAAWGYSQEEAKLANDDTFHWTNCSPQHEIYNQADKATTRGLLLWGNLERAVSQVARRYGDRIDVFNGPIYADDDRPYRQGFFVPKEFWKVIVVRADDGGPRALAFRLSQADQIADLARERFAPDELVGYAPFQVRIADLEAATGLDFGPLKDWDPLDQGADARESVRGGDGAPDRGRARSDLLSHGPRPHQARRSAS